MVKLFSIFNKSVNIPSQPAPLSTCSSTSKNRGDLITRGISTTPRKESLGSRTTTAARNRATREKNRSKDRIRRSKAGEDRRYEERSRLEPDPSKCSPDSVLFWSSLNDSSSHKIYSVKLRPIRPIIPTFRTILILVKVKLLALIFVSLVYLSSINV